MNLSIGIVGLPNVGKSTLFNALLKQNLALAANYPFATIEPNIGIAAIPNAKLEVLAEIVRTNTIKPATVEFVDIAGLVRGASQGEGLGNKFLSHIQATSAIAHVLRVFTDPDIIRDQPLDPLEDLATIRLELQLADLDILDKQKPPKGKISSELQQRFQLIEQFKKTLSAEKSLFSFIQALNNPDEQALALQITKELNLLTSKPEIFVLNVSENDLKNTNQLIQTWSTKLQVPSHQVVVVSAKVEAELGCLSPADQQLFLAELGVTKSGLDRLAEVAYATLDLQSFLTAGELEVRAWTIAKNTPANLAAGVIHTDFTKKFVKAKVCSFADFVKYQGWKAAADAGKVRFEGKDYLLRPDDIVEFMIGN